MHERFGADRGAANTDQPARLVSTTGSSPRSTMPFGAAVPGSESTYTVVVVMMITVVNLKLIFTR
jgi:hypothetical protein